MSMNSIKNFELKEEYDESISKKASFLDNGLYIIRPDGKLFDCYRLREYLNGYEERELLKVIEEEEDYIKSLKFGELMSFADLWKNDIKFIISAVYKNSVVLSILDNKKHIVLANIFIDPFGTVDYAGVSRKFNLTYLYQISFYGQGYAEKVLNYACKSMEITDIPKTKDFTKMVGDKALFCNNEFSDIVYKELIDQGVGYTYFIDLEGKKNYSSYLRLDKQMPFIQVFESAEKKIDPKDIEKYIDPLISGIANMIKSNSGIGNKIYELAEQLHKNPQDQNAIENIQLIFRESIKKMLIHYEEKGEIPGSFAMNEILKEFKSLSVKKDSPQASDKGYCLTM